MIKVMLNYLLKRPNCFIYTKYMYKHKHRYKFHFQFKLNPTFGSFQTLIIVILKLKATSSNFINSTNRQTIPKIQNDVSYTTGFPFSSNCFGFNTNSFSSSELPFSSSSGTFPSRQYNSELLILLSLMFLISAEL